VGCGIAALWGRVWRTCYNFGDRHLNCFAPGTWSRGCCNLAPVTEVQRFQKDWIPNQMANTFSALKRMRIEKRRTEINRARRSRFRKQIKALRKLLEQQEAGAAQEMLPQTFSLVDRAAKRGIITKNTAARYKSRLHARFKKLQPTAA